MVTTDRCGSEIDRSEIGSQQDPWRSRRKERRTSLCCDESRCSWNKRSGSSRRDPERRSSGSGKGRRNSAGSSETRRDSVTPRTQTAGSYHPLQRIDEVLQVDVVSVPFDVCQEEVVDPLSDLALEKHRQHRRRQLQDEDEADDARKLTRWEAADQQKVSFKVARDFKTSQTSLTYKLQKTDVFPQSSNTAGEAQGEGDSAHHQDQPHWIKTM